VLFFEAIAFPVIHTPYPPYSAVCWSFAGLGVYLYTLGIYFSAISVSHDSKLRLAIRQFTAMQSKLLDNIGTAQMEEAIQNRVTKIVKEQEEVVKEQTGIQQVPNEEDIKFYIEEVIQEIKKNRKQE